MSAPISATTSPSSVRFPPAAWWLTFFSPTLSFLAVTIFTWLRFPDLIVQAALVATFLSPLIAIVSCLPVLWSRYPSTGVRVMGITVALLGILLQFAFVLVIFAAVVTAMISYAQ